MPPAVTTADPTALPESESTTDPAIVLAVLKLSTTAGGVASAGSGAVEPVGRTDKELGGTVGGREEYQTIPAMQARTARDAFTMVVRTSRVALTLASAISVCRRLSWRSRQVS